MCVCQYVILFTVTIAYNSLEADYMLPCVFSFIVHRWRQNVLQTKSGNHAIADGVTDYHILTSSVISEQTHVNMEYISFI